MRAYRGMAMRPIRHLTLIALVAGLLLTSAAPAYAACNPNRSGSGTGFAGTQGGLAGVQGVHAYIEEYHPWTAAGGFSLMWVMLNSGGTLWSQIGWWQTPGAHQAFEQHTDASGHWFTNYWPDQGGITNDYKVVQSAVGPGQTVWNFYINGSLKLQPTRVWSATGYQLYGETHSKADQMAGGFSTAGTKAVFSGGQKQNSSLVWSAVATAAGTNDNTIYGAQLTSGTYYIWDKGCQS